MKVKMILRFYVMLVINFIIITHFDLFLLDAAVEERF